MSKKQTASDEQNKEQSVEQNNEQSNVAEQAVNPLAEQVNELNEKLLRSFAEFDNFKKRTSREKLELAEYTKANCFMDILSVVDNFERALCIECKDAEFKKGMEMILIQFKDALKSQGLVEIEALNQEFDPNFHNAINQVEDDSLPSNTVCNVLQTGYKIGEKVVRHAMVAVVQ